MSWESQAIALLTASLARPFALAATAWLILRVLRVRHPASRHAVWTAVLTGMLLPFVRPLESAKGSGEFLVIDRVERPSGN